jgi:hypothetical protein
VEAFGGEGEEKRKPQKRRGEKKEELIVVEDFRTLGAFQRLQGDLRGGGGVGGKRKTYKGGLGISDGEGNVRSYGDGCVG